MRYETLKPKLSKYCGLLILLILSSLVIACKKVEVNISNSPQYPCKGENVTLFYRTHNVDRLVVKNNLGTQIYESDGGSGNFVIENIDHNMLPLKVKGWQGDKSDTVTVGPSGDYTLRIIDNEIKTDTINFSEKVSTLREESMGQYCGCNIYAGTSITCVEYYPAVAVYEKIVEKKQNLAGQFSTRAKVTKLHNETNMTLIFQKDGQSIEVSGNSEVDVSDKNISAKGYWTTKLKDPYEGFRGVYIKAPKINNCNATAGFIESYLVDIGIQAKLSVICNL